MSPRPSSPRACVMGHQVGYSRSPLMHRYWLRTLGISGSYEVQDVAPEAFPKFFRNLQRHGFVGGNITKPHKAAAFGLVDLRETAAVAIGAVNTVFLAGDRLVGTNTDAQGYLANLDQEVPGWDRSAARAVVIGAGGAARAVVYALITRGFKVAIVNRTRSHADALVQRFSGSSVSYPWSDLPRLLTDARVLTNASVLGARGEPSLPLDLTRLAQGAVVCDIVYVPLKTDLLATARERGHPTADGLGMLMHQAVPGFARWFGVTPTVTAELRALLAADIGASTGTA
jgi:shikimate dehydrogenase